MIESDDILLRRESAALIEALAQIAVQDHLAQSKQEPAPGSRDLPQTPKAA